MAQNLDANNNHQAALHAARTTPHLHVPRFVHSAHVSSLVHGASELSRFNAAVAVWITKVVGTMYCAYLFAAIAFVALPAALDQGSPTVFVNWLSSNFLQLVLLPIIIVGQKVISAVEEARAEADRAGPGCLNRFSASISGASAGVRLPSGGAAG